MHGSIPRLLALGVHLALMAATARASTGAHFFATDRNVIALEFGGDTLFVGGNYRYLGPLTGSAMPFSAATGDPDPGFPHIRPAWGVYATASDGQGGWYLGGMFDSVGTIARRNLAHVLANGEVHDWAPTPNWGVTCMALDDSTIYVAGDFDSIGTTPRRRFAAIDRNTGALRPLTMDLQANPEGQTAIFKLARRDSVLFVAGWFGAINGSPRRNIAALDPNTGVPLPWAPMVECLMPDLAVNDAAVFVSRVNSVNGISVPQLASISRSTGALLPWNPALYGTAVGVELAGDTLYVAGHFSAGYGLPMKVAEGFDARTGATVGPTVGADGAWDAWGCDVAVVGDTLFVAALYSRDDLDPGDLEHNVVAARRSTGQPLPMRLHAAKDILTLAAGNGQLLVGGEFQSVGGRRRQGLTAIDTRTMSILDWNPGKFGFVSDLAVTPSEVWVSSRWPVIAGVTYPGLVAIDRLTGLVTAPMDGAYEGAGIPLLLAHGDRLYLSGDFTSVEGLPRSGLAAIRLSDHAVDDWAPSVAGVVSDLATDGTALFLGGSFWQVNGVTRSRLASVGLLDGALLPWNPGANEYVRALDVSSGRLIAVGGFTQIGASPRARIASFGLPGGELLPWHPDLQQSPTDVEDLGHGVLVAGFSGGIISGNPAPSALLDAVSGAPLDTPWLAALETVASSDDWLAFKTTVWPSRFALFPSDTPLLGAEPLNTRPRDPHALAVFAHPVPARRAVQFELDDDGSAPAMVRLMDVGGRAVRESVLARVGSARRGARLDLAGLAPGLYFAQVTSGTRKGSTRIVVVE